MSRYARRRDANEPAIIAAAERAGFKCFRINDGADVIAQLGSKWDVWEIKTEKGALTDLQCKLRKRGMTPAIIRTVDDVLARRKALLKQ